MSKHRVTLPLAEWPPEIRERLENALSEVSAHQRRRLIHGMGRWLKAARDDGISPDRITAALWRARTVGLKQTYRGAVRQAVVTVFPTARGELYAGSEDGRKSPRSPHDKLASLIERTLARWPADWRLRAQQMLRIDPEGLDSGLLVQAWSRDTIKGRVENLSAHFAFCRSELLPVDVTPQTVRANLRHRQQLCAAGALRIGGTSVYLSQLCGLAAALWPERKWTWLRKTRDKMKKLAGAHPSRNDGRVVSIVELRLEALAELKRADHAQGRARTQRQCIAAHTRARTALGMLIIAEAPIRVESLAGIEIGGQLSADLGTISLSAHETKEGAPDQRCLSDIAVAAITKYIQSHRSLVAPSTETRLFVADDGAPLSGDHLSRKIGDHCESKFGRRTTAHPIRNSVGAFIVGEAPEEAGLAGAVLNHKSEQVTSVYTRTADQVRPGEKLRDATTTAAALVGVRPARKVDVRPRRSRSLRAELAEGAARRR